MTKVGAKFGPSHYEVIATIIRDIEPKPTRDMIIRRFVDGFNKRSNVFDAGRFKDRCEPLAKAVVRTSEGRHSKIVSKYISMPEIPKSKMKDADT